MARGDLLCPIDRSTMSLPNWQDRGGIDPNDVNTHVHMFFTGQFTCQQGHRWVVNQEDSDIVLQRVQ